MHFYLEINTIYIKNNTFSQLIMVLECTVGFESMKIWESNVKKDMINIEHTTWRMANTCIENADNLLTSAFTNTWTYSRNRYFPFEITNTEIMSKHELSVSAQPIIQLSGNISLWNIKVLVTSTFVVEITAQKSIFPRSWNIIESLKTPRKYHLPINFLTQKKTVFPITEKFKIRNFH